MGDTPCYGVRLATQQALLRQARKKAEAEEEEDEEDEEEEEEEEPEAIAPKPSKRKAPAAKPKAAVRCERKGLAHLLGWWDGSSCLLCLITGRCARVSAVVCRPLSRKYQQGNSSAVVRRTAPMCARLQRRQRRPSRTTARRIWRPCTPPRSCLTTC